MSLFARLIRRLRYFLRRKGFDREIEEELRFHLELETAKNRRKGMAPADARRHARLAFGAVDRHVEEARRARGTLPLENTLRDLRLGLRQMRRRPLYAMSVSGTLALGITAAALTLSVTWQTWLSAPPYPDPDRVVRLYEVEPTNLSTSSSSSTDGPPATRLREFSDPLALDFKVHDWRTVRSVSSVVYYDQPRPTQVAEVSVSVKRLLMNPEAIEIFGLSPIVGRLPSPGSRETLMSERLWRETFAADLGILGSRLGEGGTEGQIVGVVRIPPVFRGEADLLGLGPWDGNGPRDLRRNELIARVAPGFSVAQAEDEMNALVTSLAEIYPEHRGWRIEAVVLSDALVAPFRDVLALVLAAGFVFLSIAAVNVLGLVAARHIETGGDQAIRVAMGASGAQLLRASVTESVALMGVGTGMGIAAALWLVEPMRALLPGDLPRLTDVSVSPGLVGSLMGGGLVLGILVGILAYLASRGDGWRGSSSFHARTSSAHRRASGRTIVVGQIALTTLLTAAGTTVLHRVSALNAVDLGFARDGVSMTMGTLRGENEIERTEEIRAVRAGLAARGIRSAFAFNTPMDNLTGNLDLPTFALRPDPASDPIEYQAQTVTEGYFSLMGIGILEGRAFQDSDGPTSENVIIVSEAFARGYLPLGAEAGKIVGRIIEDPPLARGPARVVGVAESTRHEGPDAPLVAAIYVPFPQQRGIPVATLLVQGEVQEVQGAVAAVLEQFASEGVWTPLEPYSSYWDEWFAPFRLQLLLVGVLAVLGLILASLGLHSLLAYRVLRERREIGIRKAVGASDASLMAGVVGRGLATALGGALIGLAAWYAAAPFLRQWVVGAETVGAAVPMAVAFVVGGSALVATLAPGFAASRTDPMAALRTE